MRGILICGLNGSGKTTLGKELAKKLNYQFMDIEDYYFPQKELNYQYTFSRSKQEVIKLLLRDMNKDFVFAAVTGDYGQNIIEKFSCVILIDIPKEESLKRVKKRSYEQFGDRMRIGGDLYEKEKEFFAKVSLKSQIDIEKWMDTLICPIIKVDGTKPISSNLNLIIKKLSKMEAFKKINKKI